MLSLPFLWRTSFVSNHRYESQTRTAVHLARLLSGVADADPLQWVHFGFQEEPSPDLDIEPFDDETCLLHNTLGVISDQEEASDHEVGDTRPSDYESSSMVEQDLLLWDSNPVSRCMAYAAR